MLHWSAVDFTIQPSAFAYLIGARTLRHQQDKTIYWWGTETANSFQKDSVWGKNLNYHRNTYPKSKFRLNRYQDSAYIAVYTPDKKALGNLFIFLKKFSKWPQTFWLHVLCLSMFAISDCFLLGRKNSTLIFTEPFTWHQRLIAVTSLAQTQRKMSRWVL